MARPSATSASTTHPNIRDRLFNIPLPISRPCPARQAVDCRLRYGQSLFMAQAPRPARPRVFVTRALPDPVEARLAELFDAVLNSGDVPLDRDALAAGMADCDVFVPT